MIRRETYRMSMFSDLAISLIDLPLKCCSRQTTPLTHFCISYSGRLKGSSLLKYSLWASMRIAPFFDRLIPQMAVSS